MDMYVLFVCSEDIEMNAKTCTCCCWVLVMRMPFVSRMNPVYIDSSQVEQASYPSVFLHPPQGAF